MGRWRKAGIAAGCAALAWGAVPEVAAASSVQVLKLSGGGARLVVRSDGGPVGVKVSRAGSGVRISRLPGGSPLKQKDPLKGKKSPRCRGGASVLTCRAGSGVYRSIFLLGDASLPNEFEVRPGGAALKLVGGGDFDIATVSGPRGAPFTVTGGDGADRLADDTSGTTAVPGTIDGGDGNDTITGSARGNKLSGGAGDDFLSGLGGGDQLFGGADDDTLLGGAGDDGLEGGDGLDALRGDDGDDSLLTKDGVGDPEVDCGAGTGDSVIADATLDKPIGCESGL